MFPLVATELGDFLIKGMREFVFLGGGWLLQSGCICSRIEKNGRHKGMEKGWRGEGDGEKSMANGRGGRKEKEEEEEGTRISMMINASCEGT